jgi:hypothetical protein
VGLGPIVARARVLVQEVLDRSARLLSAGQRRYLNVGRGAVQVIDRGAQGVSRGGARCASQVLDRGAQADARDAATPPQQEKNNSADEQRDSLTITGSICTVAR